MAGFARKTSVLGDVASKDHTHDEQDTLVGPISSPLHREHDTLNDGGGNLSSDSQSSQVPAILTPSSQPNMLRLESQESCSDTQSCRIQTAQRSFYKRLTVGGLLGATSSMWLLALLFLLDPKWLKTSSSRISLGESHQSGTIRGEAGNFEPPSYFEVFPKPLSNLSASKNMTAVQRHLASTATGSGGSSGGSSPSGTSGSSKTGSFKDTQLVIAGKMSVEDAPCNIAQFNLKTSEWSLTERIQLSLYNSYSGGEVYSLLANHSMQADSDSLLREVNANRSVSRSLFLLG